uniref:SFRICE_023803 n=1 Tax=Spodoptera frugiperda TaxID=7108 RepID=A0A2H1VJ10_SPOFR
MTVDEAKEVGDTTRLVAAAAEADAWTTMMVSAEPSRSNEIANDHVIMQILTDPIVPQSVTNGDTTDDVQGNAYNGFYSSTVNFNDIYSNNLVVLGEDPAPHPAPAPVPEPAPPSTEKEEDSFQLKNLPAEYVEFRPQTQAVSPATLPPAIYILNSTYILNINTTESSSTSTTITTEVTEEPAEISVKVIPIKKDYQRGILDLLFPAARVKTFKTVFDTFRHLMSHTFR